MAIMEGCGVSHCLGVVGGGVVTTSKFLFTTQFKKKCSQSLTNVTYVSSRVY